MERRDLFYLWEQYIRVCLRYDEDVDSVVSAGYKFAADHPAISTVLTGTSNIKHLNQNAKALEKPKLPIKDKKQLISIFSHIPEIQ